VGFEGFKVVGTLFIGWFGEGEIVKWVLGLAEREREKKKKKKKKKKKGDSLYTEGIRRE